MFCVCIILLVLGWGQSRLPTSKKHLCLVLARGWDMSMHLQDYYYSWYFVLFHLLISETLTQAHACVCPTGRLSDTLHENICSNHIFCFNNNLVCFWTLTQAHTCRRALVANQPIGNTFADFCWGHVRVATCSRLPGVCWLIALFYCGERNALRRCHIRITRICCFDLLITDIPCLVFELINCQNFRPGGAHDRHSVFPFWELCFVSCETIRQTNEQTNKRTRLFRFV